ncbi:TPA: hypothetical protein SFZ30_001766 [Campylobacter coli]|uniref:hypothetical protein n=2 Tax=Campylobacter coli TaxID=195 RepID=UPI0009306363|nr:hypothetical protein [Campylobacter coli]ECL0812305.1 hypothetical protein [Campylobacter coli]ECL3469904.1 hypothetical protein [Campylobacter coli]ECO3069755.1 hypothetical protein [Campylobacter coli]ECQ7330206.1 hypothetical protein [Campylobacter coli]ECQ7450331.1 hypothetical protein [Campylobacter coli]
MISLNSHYPNINYPNNALSIKKDENNEYAYAKKDEPKSEEDAYWEDFVQKYFGEMLSKEYANKYGYNGDPDVKEVENSLLERMRKDKLTEEEWEILNGAYDIDNIEFIPRDKIARIREANLLKTLTSASEFARIWVAEKDERKKRFIDALDVKPLTQEEIDRFLNKQQSSNSTQESNENGQNPDEKPFKAIQSESQNKETYKDDSKMNELVKKLLENKFGKSEELELLFGVKFSDDNTGEFNKILSLNSTPKSIDIKA